ncbi:hypothetical protein SPBR_06265 [Sporothrix brasiliensis 5110]|uniref:CFEM domain-containing protein n=1 Tax=Sporothrix brasiliensis 5110 TaxID=1398154 RepID=A0A0C2J4C9_9PEZI|nr:uncharacterized protein SPBR_06265 [Sporothrix brasiliensis 5110]KIH93880.1 hypothetical protein SPBR_06265 [Sporothrix brasiliensis 5110]
MKLSLIFSVVAGAVAVSAACAPDPAHPFPACAADCMATAITAIGCTSATDYECQCKNFDKLHSSAGDCITKACGAAAADVATAAEALCKSCGPPPAGASP